MSNRLTAGDKKNIPPSPCPFVGILIVIIFLAPVSAWAHGVNVFAYVEGNTVVVEGYFHDGAKCRDCAIEAFGSDGNKIAEGKTDEDGRFSFEAPAADDLLLLLTASMGHRAEYRMPATDLPGAPAHTQNETDEHVNPNSGSAHEAPAVPLDGYVHDPAEIERLVEKVISRQLTPIRRELEESRRRRRLSDIIGGLGYIAGLMGLILYVRGKQRH